ncbi:MAG: CPBP family intramembrane metalloprotease [Calditrichia bacterium]
MNNSNKQLPGPFFVMGLIFFSYFVVFLLFEVFIRLFFPDASVTSKELLSSKYIMAILELGLLVIPVLYFMVNKYNLKDVFLIRKSKMDSLLWVSVLGIGLFPVLDEMDRLIQVIFNFDPIDESLFEALKYTNFGEFVVLFIGIVIVASIVEELLFRGLLLQSIANRLGIIQAIFISSILWSLLHGVINWTLQIFIMGMLLGLLVYYLRSAFPAILLHSINNFMSLIFLNLDKKSSIIVNYQTEQHVRWYWIILGILFIFISSKKLFVKRDTLS